MCAQFLERQASLFKAQIFILEDFPEHQRLHINVEILLNLEDFMLHQTLHVEVQISNREDFACHKKSSMEMNII